MVALTKLEQAARAWREADEALWACQDEIERLEELSAKAKENRRDLMEASRRAEEKLRLAARGVHEDSQV